jgi:uncharacterized membrane protein YqjE
MAALDEALSTATDGRAVAVEIVGEPGIGKTRSLAKPPHTSIQPVHEAALGGAGGAAAAALFVLTTILTQVAPIGADYESSTDYLHQVVLGLAYVAVLVTLIGLHARKRRSQRYGLLGALGTVLTALGYGAILVVVVAGIVAGERVLNEARIAAAAVLLVGSVLLGVATLRTRVAPWWCGALLIVTFPVGDAVNQAFAGAEALVLALLWGSLGAALKA